MVQVEPSLGRSSLEDRLGEASIDERRHELHPEDITETQGPGLTGLHDADRHEPGDPILGNAGFRRDLLRGKRPRHRPILFGLRRCSTTALSCDRWSPALSLHGCTVILERGMSVEERFDLVVIGAGPAGEKGAAQAAYFGKGVAGVERSAVPGGTPASTGGIPTKTMREAALYLTGFRRREVYGVGLDLAPEVSLDRIRARAGEVVRLMIDTVRENLDRHGIELIRGEGRLGADRSVLVRSEKERTLKGQAVLIATGSRSFRPATVPFDDPDVEDSESILELDRVPGRLVVVGGGPVGCEYASLYAALGVEVVLVVAGEGVRGDGDPPRARPRGRGDRAAAGGPRRDLGRRRDRVAGEGPVRGGPSGQH